LSDLFYNQDNFLCKTSSFPHQSNFSSLSWKNFFFSKLKKILKKINEKLLNLFAMKKYETKEIFLRINDTEKKDFIFKKKFWIEFQKKNLKKNWDKDIQSLKGKTNLVPNFKKKKKAIHICNKKIKNLKQNKEQDKKQKSIKKTENFIGRFRITS
jgi:hypothetical protein